MELDTKRIGFSPCKNLEQACTIKKCEGTHCSQRISCRLQEEIFELKNGVDIPMHPKQSMSSSKKILAE